MRRIKNAQGRDGRLHDIEILLFTRFSENSARTGKPAPPSHVMYGKPRRRLPPQHRGAAFANSF
jgi:hypothetical protein